MTKICTNALTLFGDKASLDSLKNLVGLDQDKFSFESIDPSPQELIDASRNDLLTPRLVEKFGAMNINSWRLKEWGCVKDSWDVKILDESEMNQSNLSKAAKEKVDDIPEDKKEQFLNLTANINAAMSVVFSSVESPNHVIHKLSVKFPSILIHYGYDSESEDVSGWVALKGGEQLGHQHYSNCLKNIRIHVEPHHDETSKLVEAMSSDDSDDDSN